MTRRLYVPSSPKGVDQKVRKPNDYLPSEDNDFRSTSFSIVCLKATYEYCIASEAWRGACVVAHDSSRKYRREAARRHGFQPEIPYKIPGSPSMHKRALVWTRHEMGKKAILTTRGGIQP